MVLIALRIHLCHFLKKKIKSVKFISNFKFIFLDVASCTYVIFELFIGIVFCVSEIRISFDVLLRSHVGSRVVSHAFFVSNLELLLSVDFTGVTATC